MEQTIAWQSPLYVCFVGVERAFDSVDRESVWKILLHYRIPEKMVNTIKMRYSDFSCQVIHDSRLWRISCHTEARQGCLLSPLLFLDVLDLTSKTAYANSGKGIQGPWWGSWWPGLRRPRFFCHTVCKIKSTLWRKSHSEEDNHWRLKITQEKSKIMRMNNKQETPIAAQGAPCPMEDVEEFAYLGRSRQVEQARTL